MATGTIAPIGKHQFFDDNGNPLNGGLLYTYAAGTTTPLATYTNVGLTVANANPVVLDSAGRCTLFLTAASYKWILKTSAGVTLWSQDNIGAVPTTTINLDVDATAGEALSAGDVAYLSDGSGARTAGRWYKADADLPYASGTGITVGIVPTAIALADTGTVRQAGRVTGLSGLTVGAAYFVSATAGGMTATPPANARLLGVADTTTSLILFPEQRGVGNPGICAGRLTLTTGTPVTATDVTAATTLYFTPYQGNQIALYDGTRWTPYTFTERSITLVGLTASTPYDVFLYDNAGTLTLELTAWTNTTTRATALVFQNGVYVKTGATTRRYLGTVYINASGGQTDDSIAKRYVWNYTNRVTRTLRRQETTDSWPYTSASIRQVNGSTANQVEVMVGVAEDAIDLHAMHLASQNNITALEVWTGIGEDSTSAPAAECLHGNAATYLASSAKIRLSAYLTKTPVVGWHKYTWLEYSEANGGGTTTWYGDNGGSAIVQTGLSGTWKA